MLRIGTWNVEYAYARRLDTIREVIAQNPADIWILTETHDDLRPYACPNAVHSGPRPKNWNGIREGSRWVSIWSKYPVIEQVAVPGGDTERTVVAKIDTGMPRPLLVYGTVLPWKGDRGAFNWDEHHRVIREQSTEWQVLRAAHPDTDLCIAGDYNTDMGTGRHYGTKRGISELTLALDACGLFCATGPGSLPEGLLPYPPIDHIAVPTAWQSGTKVAAAWPADRKRHSDHSGLVVSVDLQC